jgi:hypothetical protein
MRKQKIKPLTVKDIADRYFAAQCKRLGPIVRARPTRPARANQRAA